MAWSSSAPDAVDALVDTFRAAPEFQDITVWDGPEVSKATPREMLSVAFTGDENDSDVEASSAAEGLGLRDRETFTVRCAAAVVMGSTDMRAARRRAYELYAAAGAVLARDHTLARRVMRARLGSHNFKQLQTDRGAQALVVFGIDVDAFTRH